MQTVTQQIESIKGDICSNYCKYAVEAHEKWLRDELETDVDEMDYLIDMYCDDCPLSRL